jgi:hypothetical protein
MPERAVNRLKLLALYYIFLLVLATTGR